MEQLHIHFLTIIVVLLGYMLISALKISPLLLVLLFLPELCAAEDDSAPAKFYDDLPIEAETADQYYTVKPNESLSIIAARYGYNYLKLAEWNNISAPYRVVSGQRLKLLQEKNVHSPKIFAADKPDDFELLEQELDLAIARGKQIATKKSAHTDKFATNLNQNSDDEDKGEIERYTVGKNESLAMIAARFNVAPEQLAAWNAITASNQLHLGQKLKIFKNKQKHSFLKTSKKSPKLTEISRDKSQKTSIISINNKSMLKFYCHWPTKGKVIKTFSQSGGRGIEISGKTGQAIKATALGKVVAVGPGIYGHGSFIVIQHADLILSTYANNSRSLVKKGQAVAQGQMIAEMGRVGRKPPSLAFEIRKNGALVDPMRCLPKKHDLLNTNRCVGG